MCVKIVLSFCLKQFLCVGGSSRKRKESGQANFASGSAFHIVYHIHFNNSIVPSIVFISHLLLDKRPSMNSMWVHQYCRPAVLYSSGCKSESSDDSKLRQELLLDTEVRNACRQLKMRGWPALQRPYGVTTPQL